MDDLIPLGPGRILAPVRHLLWLLAPLLLTGCPADPCAGDLRSELLIGGGNELSGFLPLQDGEDIAMWSVRHDWNRMVPLNLRATGLSEHAWTETFELSVGLYQDEALVAGVSVDDASPTAGPDGSGEFLGLLAQLVTHDYAPHSGLPTSVEAELVDGCGGVTSSSLDVVLWDPDDLCATAPEPGSLELGRVDAGGSFVPLAQQEETDVLDLGAAGLGLAVSARATNADSPLTGSYVLQRVVIERDHVEVGRLEPELVGPTGWNHQTAWFLELQVPFDGWEPLPGEAVRVTVVLDDACRREVQAAIELLLR